MEEDALHLSVLEKNYLEGARRLTAMGFNGLAFGLELSRAVELKRPDTTRMLESNHSLTAGV